MKVKRLIGPLVVKMRFKHLGESQPFFKRARSISARATCVRKGLFSCASASLPAGCAAWLRAARTHLPHTASRMPRACATRDAACPSCVTRRTASVWEAASYVVRCSLASGFSASMARESYFLCVHFCPTTPGTNTNRAGAFYRGETVYFFSCTGRSSNWAMLIFQLPSLAFFQANT